MDTKVFAGKVARKALGIPALLSSQILSFPPVTRRLTQRYEASKQQYKHRIPTLSQGDADIVARLNETGVHITTLEALDIPGTAAMFDAGRELAGRYRAMHQNGSLEYKDAFQASADDVMSHREIFDWGLNERLLSIAETYLGLPVGYDGINLFYTKADGRQVAARKWHRDIEDRRMMKIAVYFNDVDEGGGPLQILNPTLPGTESDSLPNYPVLTHEGLAQKLGVPLTDSVITTCTGPAGTVIFTDTARKYHRGKPAVDHDRCAVFYNYFSRVPLRPFFCERSTLSRAQIMEMASTLTLRQRDCLLWRNSLPILARMIPPAPI